MPDQLQPAAPDTASWIGRVDPRARIVTAVLLSVIAAAATGFAVPAMALGAAVLALGISGLSLRTVFRRLLPLNVLMLAMVLLLPLTTPGEPLAEIGPVRVSWEGLQLAAIVALKGNAIVLVLLVLLGSVDANTLGHALNHLRMPDKLTHLLLFSVRYLDVLHREHSRLAAAMKTRGFRPRMDRHTYRTYGYLVGMLLVRSFDRSDRIVAAMKCRGFRGRFYLLDHFAFSRRDVAFGAVSAAILAALILVEC